MKILIVGDNHCDYDIISALDLMYKDYDLKVHTGDSQFDEYEIDVLKNWHKVRGNNDFLSENILPKFEVIETKLGNIFLTHGHYYSVKSQADKQSLLDEAKKYNAKIVVYGHTHVLDVQKVDDVILLNPNSIRLPIMPRQKSFLDINWTENSIDIIVRDYDANKIGEYHF